MVDDAGHYNNLSTREPISAGLYDNSELQSDECWLDVVELFAGLEIDGRIELARNTAIEKILDANLVANAARIAKEVTLGLPSDENAPLHPIYGMKYRVRGKILFGAEEARFNREAIARPKKAFLRAISLLRGQRLINGGSFVYETNSVGHRRLQSYQFNTGTFSVHYSDVYIGTGDADQLRLAFKALLNPYLDVLGKSIAIAIDRLGIAGTRENHVDRNLDLCIAAEIAFLFGMNSDNEKITENVRENARVFFGDGEFFWNRDDVAQVVHDSYRERSHTVHGRRGSDLRADALAVLNARLREILKAVLWIYVQRQPTKSLARRSWAARREALEQNAVMGPIFK